MLEAGVSDDVTLVLDVVHCDKCAFAYVGNSKSDWRKAVSS